MPRKSNKNAKNQSKQNKMEKMKMEIANDFGVKLGAESTSRENGLVGGQMTRRLVQMAKGEETSHAKSNKSRSNK